MRQLITTFFEKGDCLPQNTVGLCKYRPASTGWFVSFHLWADLIEFVLKKGSYLAGKVEGCHLENGCVQAWELALLGRWVCFRCESSKCNWITHKKVKRNRKIKDQTIIWIFSETSVLLDCVLLCLELDWLYTARRNYKIALQTFLLLASFFTTFFFEGLKVVVCLCCKQGLPHFFS